MSAEYPKEIIAPRVKRRGLGGTIRILPSRYADTPLQAVRSDSRFSKDDPAYPAVLYLAQNFQTAFLETLVRDRFVSKAGPCQVPWKEVKDRIVVTLAKAPRPLLKLIDLTGDGCTIIRAHTDAARAANHQEGRELARALYEQHKDLDGIIYQSRFDSQRCYAIFEHAASRLPNDPPVALSRHSELESTLDKYRVELTRFR